MNNVLASAAEAEVGGLFINGQAACPLRTTLTKLGHHQPPTIIVTDNECAQGIANDTVKQKRSKAIDMRFYWIRDRVAQNQFQILWKKGADNLADYFTKHHPPSHHRQMRQMYLQQDTANTATCERIKFAQHTEFKTTSTLPHHQNNQASQRSENHNNRMKDSLQRRDDYIRNNQPWIEVKSKSHNGTAAAAQTAARYRIHQLTKFNDHTVDDAGVHCEGVLNNDYSHTVTTSVPRVPRSETPFPRTQASNDSSPCSKARLIGGQNTDRYWPKRLVQRPLHIRQ
jgi:hypothetical protein